MKKKIVAIVVCTLLIAMVLPATGVINETELVTYPATRQERDYGDAPEGDQAIAYPSLGVIGSFPTCKCCGPGTWIEHNNFGGYFGQGVDFEPEGNGGLCPQCFPPYDQDDRYQDGDAGLIMPEPFTIDNSLNVVPFTGYTGTPLGSPGQTAVWGVDVDIWVHNTMPNHEPYVEGYVNVLMDWNQNGIWNDDPSEHILINWFIPPLYIGSLSGLAPPNFGIGPNSGYVWTRFTITEKPVQTGWMGDGEYEDGESEDYLLLIEGTPDLDCDGSLHWTGVTPGDTVTGSFDVYNDGPPGSKLDWEIVEWPDWGQWTFNPIDGDDLKPEDGLVTVDVTVVSPEEIVIKTMGKKYNEEYTGQVKIENKENSADFCLIDVYLETPVNQNNAQSYVLNLLHTILQRFSYMGTNNL